MTRKTRFDPAFFLYLNPAVLNLDVETAEAYYAENIKRSLYGDASLLPTCFNEKIYIEHNKDVCDVSNLNMYIKTEQNSQCDEDDTCGCRKIDCRYGDFVDNISMPLELVAKNTFLVAVPSDGEISERMINVNDEIKIRKGKCDFVYATVTEVDRYEYKIKVTNRYFDFVPKNEYCDRYFLLGIKVADVRRIAIINFIKNAVKHNDKKDHVPYKLDAKFNVELYKMLYPDARCFSQIDAYKDLISRDNRGEHRIRSVKDMATTLNLVIDSPVTFMGIEIKSISTDPWSMPKCDSSLITERAIKEYVDSKSYDAKFPNGLEVVSIGIGKRITRRKTRISLDSSDSCPSDSCPSDFEYFSEEECKERGVHEQKSFEKFKYRRAVKDSDLDIESYSRYTTQEHTQDHTQTTLIKSRMHVKDQLTCSGSVEVMGNMRADGLQSQHMSSINIGIGGRQQYHDIELEEKSKGWINDPRVTSICAARNIDISKLNSYASVVDFMLDVIIDCKL